MPSAGWLPDTRPACSHYLNPVNLPWTDLRMGAWLTLTGGRPGW